MLGLSDTMGILLVPAPAQSVSSFVGLVSAVNWLAGRSYHTSKYKTRFSEKDGVIAADPPRILRIAARVCCLLGVSQKRGRIRRRITP